MHTQDATPIPSWLTGPAWTGGPSWEPIPEREEGVFLAVQFRFPNGQRIEARHLQMDMGEDPNPEWDIAFTGPDGRMGGEYEGGDIEEAERTVRDLIEAWREWDARDT